MINENEERVLIHCAAGIHRTGTITYTLLRMNGLSNIDAY
jgi:protein-tyrosine phosphatase